MSVQASLKHYAGFSAEADESNRQESSGSHDVLLEFTNCVKSVVDQSEVSNEDEVNCDLLN